MKRPVIPDKATLDKGIFVKALLCLTIHTIVLSFCGAIISLTMRMTPLIGFLWITPILVLLTVPRAFLYSWRFLAQRPCPPRQKQIHHRVRLGLLISLSLPYLIPPGFLLSYPISDLGFRWIVGNRIQVWAVDLLRKPDTQLPFRRRYIVGGGHLDAKAFPFRFWGLTHSYVDVLGETAKNRHVIITWGGGFGHWGLLIGAPAFKTKVDNNGVRRMWNGFYCFAQ